MNEMGRVCSLNGVDEWGLGLGNLKESELLEVLGLDGVISELILKFRMG